VSTENPLLLALDLMGTFAFALNGAFTAQRVAKLDIIGVLTLGMITAMGGGIIRDILIDDLPPATFSDWRYLAVAAGGSLLAFILGPRLEQLTGTITLLDAAGLSLFAVTGASKALDHGLGAAQAIILGTVSGVGGGTIRDALTQQVPTVLRSELYAIPALVGAAITVASIRLGVYGVPAALVAAAVCFGIRVLGVHYDLNAPRPPGASHG
jgi:uncharacterized membrane protein YeiH